MANNLNLSSTSNSFLSSFGLTPSFLSNDGGISYETSWSELCSYVVELFKGQGLGCSVEHMSNLLRESKQGLSLEVMADRTRDLMAHCSHILSKKLTEAEKQRLVDRIVELWIFFSCSVLPWFSGAFVFLEKELLSSKRQAISVREIALNAFRDEFLVPVMDDLLDCLENTNFGLLESKRRKTIEKLLIPRLLQMFNVLFSRDQLLKNHDISRTYDMIMKLRFQNLNRIQ